jgi:hypothetical protein
LFSFSSSSLYRAREGRGVRSPIQSLLSFSARQQADGKRSDRQALADGAIAKRSANAAVYGVSTEGSLAK